LKKQFLVRTSITVALLALLVFNTLSFNAPVSKADPVGVGKYLTVEIDGDGYVTATKVNSGDVWYYNKTEIPTEHKLGAGTILLQAYADEGWKFSHWEENLTTTENPVEYKSEKYGYVRAVFQKVIFTITAFIAQNAPNGTIKTYGDGATTLINGVLVVSIECGGNQTFAFSPYEDNHVSSIQVDNAFDTYSGPYEFTNVHSDHTLTVYFSTDGQAYLPIGTNVPVYLGDDVGLNFTSINEEGTATQANISSLLLPQLQGTSLILWDVSVGAHFSGLVEVALPYEGTTTITVWTSDSLDALYSDVNGDGVVDGDDVSDVAVGIKTTVASEAEYDPQFDTNRDGELTEADILLVNEYKGTTLQSLTSWIVGDSLFIQTDHFSIFGGR
jgi:hypothetical protein